LNLSCTSKKLWKTSVTRCCTWVSSFHLCTEQVSRVSNESKGKNWS
jgi:hypothetical protein